jgi:hypothetical protein
MSRDIFEPRLTPVGFRSDIFRYPNNHYRKFIILTIRNSGEEEALSCHARLFSNDTPQNEYPLHWAVTPYTTSRDHSEAIDILPKETRDLDIAFSVGGTYTVNIGESTTYTITTIQPSTRPTSGTVDPRFIVHGTGASPIISDDNTRIMRFEGPRSGAWIALPLALSMPELVDQARLEPGRYEAKIRIYPINGEPLECNLVITSSVDWERLDYISLN